jgi:hypothetical protein
VAPTLSGCYFEVPQRECQELGARPGEAAYVNCVNAREAKAINEDRAMSNAILGPYQRPAPVPDFGRHVTCMALGPDMTTCNEW